LRPCSRTSFHHQPEAQHLKSSAIHKLPADYPIYRGKPGRDMLRLSSSQFDPPLPSAANFAVVHNAAFPTAMW
jgi:hypothetical protein